MRARGGAQREGEGARGSGQRGEGRGGGQRRAGRAPGFSADTREPAHTPRWSRERAERAEPPPPPPPVGPAHRARPACVRPARAPGAEDLPPPPAPPAPLRGNFGGRAPQPRPPLKFAAPPAKLGRSSRFPSSPPPPPRPVPAVQRPPQRGRGRSHPRRGEGASSPPGRTAVPQVSGEGNAAPTPRASARTRDRRAGRCPAARGGGASPHSGPRWRRRPLPGAAGARGLGRSRRRSRLFVRGRLAVRSPWTPRPAVRQPRRGPDPDWAAAPSGPRPPRRRARLRAGVLRARVCVAKGSGRRRARAGAAGAGSGRRPRAAQPGRRLVGRPRPPAPPLRLLIRPPRGGRASSEKLPRAAQAGPGPLLLLRGERRRRGTEPPASRVAVCSVREPTGRSRAPGRDAQGSRGGGQVPAVPSRQCASCCFWGAVRFPSRPPPRAPRARSPRWALRPLRWAELPFGRVAAPLPVPFGALSMPCSGYEGLPETKTLSGK